MAGVIYEPKGAAREYSELACNLYTGCDHRCKYCYAPGALRMTREAFGNPAPKKTIIERLIKDADRLARRGEQRSILLCFTCDPYQVADEEHKITRAALEILLSRGLRVTVLTKGGRRSMRDFDLLSQYWDQVAYAATLTFTDEADRQRWEPGAAPTDERITALKEADLLGIPTWVSLEPVVKPDQSLDLIRQTAPFVDLFKVGKWNHAAEAKAIDWQRFGTDAIALLEEIQKPYLIKADLQRHLPPATGEERI